MYEVVLGTNDPRYARQTPTPSVSIASLNGRDGKGAGSGSLEWPGQRASDDRAARRLPTRYAGVSEGGYSRPLHVPRAITNRQTRPPYPPLPEGFVAGSRKSLRRSRRSRWRAGSDAWSAWRNGSDDRRR